jgi:hypothetical protein
MFAPSCLNAGLFIGGDDEFVAFQGFFLPATFVQVENATGFDGKGGVSREDPASVIPGADGVGVEPSPNRASGNRGNQTGVADLPSKIRRVPVRQRNAVSGRQLARQGFNLNDQFWGKKPGDDPGVIVPPSRRVDL